MKKDDDYYMRIAMREYGGSFVEQLSHLLEHADHNNYDKLEAAFPEYFEQYRKMAKELKN